MEYMSLADIARGFIKCDNREIPYVISLVNSIKTDEFYTCLAKITESMSFNEKMENLNKCIIGYHGAKRISASGKEFYKNLTMMAEIFSGKEISNITNFLGHIYCFDDLSKKEEYIILKKTVPLLKDMLSRNKVLFRLVKNEFMTIADYCSLLTKWAVKELTFDRGKILPILFNNLDAELEKFIKVLQNPDLFNKTLQDVNRMLTLIQDQESARVKSFRNKYDIHPCHYYKQNKYLVLSSGEFVVQEKPTKIVTEKDNKIAKLFDENKRSREEISSMAKSNIFLSNLITAKDKEIKKLKKVIAEKDEEIKLLKQEKQDLAFQLEHGIVPSSRLKVEKSK